MSAAPIVSTETVRTVTRANLCPVQQWAYDGIMRLLPIEDVIWLWGCTGSGKSTVMRALHQQVGGAFLSAGDFIAALRGQHPLQMEETFACIVREALDAHGRVFIDELDLLRGAMLSDGNPRQMLFYAVLGELVRYVAATRKTLIVADDSGCNAASSAFRWGIHAFRVADYEFLFTAFLGAERAAGLRFEKIHGFAPKLDAYQIRNTCVWLGQNERIETQDVIDYLKAHHVVGNVDLEEVQAVELRDLQGLDDLIESLEANVILPFEEEALARELQLRPKRGVLLAGPPGTGKTTVGRALAHRLKSKFFLIDGTVIAGSQNFYAQVHRIFEAAKQNPDCVIFIDDSDVIFEQGQESGLYRYLLTMLDGLESKSAGRICVMLTAMNVARLPPALLRSGRIELWLETRLPDADARRAILARHLDAVGGPLAEVAVGQIVDETEGFTGADLCRIVEDGKLLLAYDRSHGRAPRPVTSYFAQACYSLRGDKQRYLQEQAQLRA